MVVVVADPFTTVSTMGCEAAYRFLDVGLSCDLYNDNQLRHGYDGSNGRVWLKLLSTIVAQPF